MQTAPALPRQRDRLTLKGLFIPLFIEQLLMNMTGTVNTLMLGHYADDAALRQSVRQTR